MTIQVHVNDEAELHDNIERLEDLGYDVNVEYEDDEDDED